jgi:hypothetical protein
MPLEHKTVKANDVRAPEVARGEALIVGRYRDDNPKVALVNPEDLAMLEDAHDLLQGLGALEPLHLDELARKTLALEDRPDAEPTVEDPEQIAALLDL